MKRLNNITFRMKPNDREVQMNGLETFLGLNEIFRERS